MSWCVGNGFIKGNSNGMLKPRDMATRAEVATVLKLFIEAISN
ncbi:S-layer homology domain-containing protein [Proteiniborus sp. DW1]|nr:S-layer homology domain-containing protein [Proteiniborus sp. DW1]